MKCKSKTSVSKDFTEKETQYETAVRPICVCVHENVLNLVECTFVIAMNDET